MASKSNSTVLVVSALIGALAGLGAGILLLRRAEQRGTETAITRREGLSVGLLVLGLLRQIAQLGDENK
jgi:hypothetical protein